MAFEFEALVGHLYVVGGRAIRTAPPGTLVEVAPKKAARGRETDTFFVMVTPSEGVTASAQFYEQTAAMAAERYFATTGSISGSLRDVLTKINQELFDHNQSGKQTYEANILCGVLREDDLIVARVGAGVLLVGYNGQCETYPEDLTNDEDLYSAPLGVHPMPMMKMKQYRVHHGTRAIFGDANLAELDQEKMREALSAGDVTAALAAFKELARLQLSLMAVEFVPPEEQIAVPVLEGQSTAEIAAKTRAAPRSTTASATASSPTATSTAAPAVAPAPEAPSRRESRRRAKARDSVERGAKRTVGKAAVSMGNGLSLISKVMEHFLGQRKDGRRSLLATPVGAGAVILLPVIVVGLVVILWLSRTGESEYEICLTEAQSAAELARSVVNNQRQTVEAAWEGALSKADECDALRPDSEITRRIREEGRAVLDGLNQITRRETRLIESFPAARLTRMAINVDNLYVMDEANDIVYSVLLSNDGASIARPGTVSIRAGRPVEGLPIGDLIDISYNVDDNVLVALDREGVLVECTPTYDVCEAQRLLGVENWVNPVAMTVWRDRVYVLDIGAGDTGRIWRYQPSGSAGYGNGPDEPFSSTRPNLQTAVDFEIDEGGSIYILFTDGIVRKFLNGQPSAFDFALFPTTDNLAGMLGMYIDDAVVTQKAYFVHPPSRTIYETTLIGTFDKSYRITNEQNFDLISAVVTSQSRAGTEYIYAASGNSIFALERG
ncbi:MAG: hypothetical protein OHK0046_16440 [Anaerolineae bacterium]